MESRVQVRGITVQCGRECGDVCAVDCIISNATATQSEYDCSQEEEDKQQQRAKQEGQIQGEREQKQKQLKHCVVLRCARSMGTYDS